MEDDEAWIDCNDDDLWVFDKCILSRKLNYNCGPADMWVPKPDFYTLPKGFILFLEGFYTFLCVFYTFPSKSSKKYKKTQGKV